MEMEAGPYLSAAYEIAEPRRHPKDELVSLVDVDQTSFELGVNPLRVGYAVLAPPEPSCLRACRTRHGEQPTAPPRRSRSGSSRTRSRDCDDRGHHRRDRRRHVGLSFANWWRARHPGAHVVVLEGGSRARRLLRTVVRDGFVWDYSGHFFHFKDPAIEAWLRARMPGQEVRTVEKRSTIRYAGRDNRLSVPEAHPPAAARRVPRVPGRPVFCVPAPVRRGPAEAPPRSFGEMLYRRLGKGITDKFLRPYNEKLYATDLDRLDVDAMGRFFPHADLADIIANMRPKPPGAGDGGYNATFTYPAGGAVQYVHALLHDLPPGTVSCGEPVTAIDLAARQVIHAAPADRVRLVWCHRRRCPRSRGCAAWPTIPRCSRRTKCWCITSLRQEGPARRPLDVLPGSLDRVLPGRLVRPTSCRRPRARPSG